MQRVVILNTFSRACLEQARGILEDANCEVVVGKSFNPNLLDRYPESEVRELLSAADAVLTASRKARIEAGTLEPGPKKLRGIVTCSIGYESIDVEACTQYGVLVSNSPVETNYEGVVQHTVLLILALMRRLDFFREWASSGRAWSPYEIASLPGYLDDNVTLGVVGLGRIGYRVARLFKQNFKTQVTSYDPYVPEEKAQQLGIKMTEDLSTLLQQSDIVTLHVPLTEETRHFIGERELKLMKKTAFLVNTSRGGVLDEDALIRVLKEGLIAGAALDVAVGEPMSPSNPLLQMQNVIVTPHIAGISSSHQRRGTEFAANNIIRLISGKVPTVVVNPIAIPKWKERFGVTRVHYGGVVHYN